MYQCPKCGNFMQWRAPMVYGVSYWICSQCGYFPNMVYSSSTNVTQENCNEEQKVCAHTGA